MLIGAFADVRWLFMLFACGLLLVVLFPCFSCCWVFMYCLLCLELVFAVCALVLWLLVLRMLIG